MADKRPINGVSRRTNKRIVARVKFQVSGRDENGRRFVVQSETRNICREGGCLVLDRDMRSGDHLKLTSIRGVQFVVRVHWCLFDVYRNVRLVGFRLLSTDHGWVIYDLPKHHRAPKLSSVLPASPDFVLSDHHKRLNVHSIPVLPPSSISVGKGKKNGDSHHLLGGSFWRKMAGVIHWPIPFRSSA